MHSPVEEAPMRRSQDATTERRGSQIPLSERCPTVKLEGLQRHAMPFVCLMLLSLSAMNARAEINVPDSPAGGVLSAWIEAFNSADVSKMDEFDARHSSRLGMLRQLAPLAEGTGGFEIVRIESDQPTSLTVLVAARKGADAPQLFRFVLAVGDEMVPKIRQAHLGPAAVPMPEAEAIAALSERIDVEGAADRFSGVLLVVRNGQTLLEKVVGKADRKLDIANTIDTKFRLGSINKMFTAVAILQLVEAGKLTLDDTLITHLSDYPNRALAQKLTLRHLLTHTGGTGDIFGDAFDAHRLQLRSHDDYVAMFGSQMSRFEPGTEHRYSNYGYVLLGAVVEAVSGRSYYDHVEQSIFQPSGMLSTGSLPESDDVPARAVGYMKVEGRWKPNAETLPWRGTAAGGGYSTAGDLLRFAQALGSGKLLPPTLFAEATQPHQGAYGYGFTFYSDGGTPGYGHGGGAEGMNSELRVYPQRGYVLIALSNFDPPAASAMVEFFAQRMPAMD
jgi:D-alanyl-D-alanine carboxypeptidase